jgi:DNA modification methylase
LTSAERTGRRARLIELEPRYCDVAVRRWEKLTGEEAVLEATGQTFDEVEADRFDEDGEA